MARQIQTDQALEEQGPPRPRGTEEYQQTGRRATIGDHVQDGAEPGGLLEVSGCQAVQGVEETRDTIQERTSSRMEGHVVQGRDGEDDPGVTWRWVRTSSGWEGPVSAPATYQ